MDSQANSPSGSPPEPDPPHLRLILRLKTKQVLESLRAVKNCIARKARPCLDFFKPHVLSTFPKADVNDEIPKSLCLLQQELSPDKLPQHSSENSHHSEVRSVSLTGLPAVYKYLQYVSDMEEDICFTWKLPKGDDKVVIRRRELGTGVSRVFHLSELRHILKIGTYDLLEGLTMGTVSSFFEGNADGKGSFSGVGLLNQFTSAETPFLSKLISSKCDAFYTLRETPTPPKAGKQSASASAQHIVVDINNILGCLNAPPQNGLRERERELGDAAGESMLTMSKPSNTSTSSRSSKIYYLCCEGLKNSYVLDMLVTVAEDLKEGDDVVKLVCHKSKRVFLEDLFGLQTKRTKRPANEEPLADVLFGHVLATVEVKEETIPFTIVVTTTKVLLGYFASVIITLRKVYGTGIENLLDITKPESQIERTEAGKRDESDDSHTLCSALRFLETEIVKRVKKESEIESDHRGQVLWTVASRKETLDKAAEEIGITNHSLEIREAKPPCKADLPTAIVHRNRAYKVLWHFKDRQGEYLPTDEGRTIIKKEHKIQFTGNGARARRPSMLMWLAFFIGGIIVIAYVIIRSDKTDPEELIQTALSILALYAATIVPLVYYTCYNGENLVDVVKGWIHLDKRREFEALSEEEKLHICLESLREPESDRGFIDEHNTSYATGSKPGGLMRVKLRPAVANLLAVGCKYCEKGDRKGLISPTGTLLELIQKKEKGCERIFHTQKVEQEERSDWTEQTECPFQDYYVG